MSSMPIRRFLIVAPLLSALALPSMRADVTATILGNARDSSGAAVPGVKVTVTNAGYGSGEGFDTLYCHFEWGNAYTLHALKKRFEKGPVDWSAKKAQAESHQPVEKSD